VVFPDSGPVKCFFLAKLKAVHHYTTILFPTLGQAGKENSEGRDNYSLLG